MSHTGRDASTGQDGGQVPKPHEEMASGCAREKATNLFEYEAYDEGGKQAQRHASKGVDEVTLYKFVHGEYGSTVH
ncbi:hypothetical protein MASR2M48_13910 [Spirochaetota bacterium]